MHIAGHDRYEEYERKGKFDFYSFACHSTFVPEDVEKMSINSNHECAKNSKKCSNILTRQDVFYVDPIN